MKKKPFLFSLLVLSLLFCACTQKPFFNDVSWEMTLEEIIEIEEGKGVFVNKENPCVYAVSGKKCYNQSSSFVYTFTDGKLNEFMVMFDDISDTKFGRIYNAIVAEKGEGEILQAFENEYLPILEVQWIDENAIMTVTYCDGTDSVPKSACITYTPIE